MALEVGGEDASSGLSKRIWDAMVDVGVMKGTPTISTTITIGTTQTTFSESSTNRLARVEQEQKFAFAIASAIVAEVTTNASLVSIPAYNAFSTGVPIGLDGGSALKIAWSLPTNIISGGGVK